MKTAAVYIRVSTDEQTELSPVSQLETVRAWAGKNDYFIPDECIFVDEGISGRSAARRPRFNVMIALAKSADRPFDTILVWKFSRFARNQEESIVYKAMLSRAGVDVISVSEPTVDGPFGSLIERIIEWMDEYYSIRLAGEVKRSMTVNARKGVRQTAPPFGYKKGPAEGGPFMVPDESEAEIVREVFRQYLAGLPVWQIVQWCNDRGVLTHRGGRIENRTVMYWLQNPVYIGLNRWTPSGRIRRDFANPDIVLTPGDHESLISEQDFEAVRQRIAEASAKHRPKSRPSFELKDWAGGVVRCADCGSTLVFQKPCYFICNGYAKGSCKHRNMIRIEDLHEAIIDRLRSDLSVSAEMSFSVHRSDDTGSRLTALCRESEQLAKRLDRIRDSYAAGVDTLEDYRRFKADIDARRAAVDGELDDLLSRSEDVAETRHAMQSAIRAALELIESDDATKEQKNAALREITDACTWRRSTSTLSISYRLFI